MSQNNTSKLFFHWNIFFRAAANAGLQKQYWIMFHVAYLLWHGLSLSPVIFVCLPSILQLGVRRINVAVILKVRVVFSSKKSLGFRGITTEGLLIHLLNSGWCFQATKPESVKLQQLFLEGPVMLLKPRQPPPHRHVVKGRRWFVISKRGKSLLYLSLLLWSLRLSRSLSQIRKHGNLLKGAADGASFMSTGPFCLKGHD